MEKRLSEHNNKINTGYTKNRLPVKLVFHYPFSTRDEAFQAEFKIKKWCRKKKEALIAKDWELIKQLAKKKINKDARPFDTIPEESLRMSGSE